MGLTYSFWPDYDKELQSPHRLSKYDVAEHLQQYATKFHLNIMLSTTIESTSYNPTEKKWTLKLETANLSEKRTVISKHLVQATGIGCGIPYLPPMEDENLYTGLSLHSTQYRNAQLLKEHGVKVR